MNSDAINLQLIELKDMIIQLNQTITNQNILIQKYLEDIAKRDATIADQKALIQYLNDKIYGKSSEKGRVPDAGQLSLFSFLNQEETEQPVLMIEPDPEEIIHVK